MGRTAGRRDGRRPWAAILAAAGGLLLVLGAVVAATGGFDFRLGGLRIRSHAWDRPVLAGLAAVSVALVWKRREVAASVRRGASRATLGRALALAAVAWTAVAGVAFSTYAAGGADSSGYLSQARLLARGFVLDESGAIAPGAPWPHPAITFAPLGYRPAPDPARLAPTYPPGLPLLMVPAFLLHPTAPYLVVPICGVIAVWLTFLVGRAAGAPLAGAVAAVLLSVSPTFLYQLVQPMSDVPVTAAWLLSLLLAARGTRAASALAGLAAGAAILIRPNLAPLAALVMAAATLGPPGTPRWQRALLVAVLALPEVVLLGVLQATRFGSPLASGYGSFESLFALQNVPHNLARYPRWLTETHTPAIWLWLLAPPWILWRCAPPRRVLPAILWGFCAAVVAAYLPYVYFQPQEWMYTRFLLPAIPVMWLLAAAMACDALARLAGWRAAAAGLPLLAALVTWSVLVAHQRDAFALKDGEAKYVEVGRLVNRLLPPDAVVISMQHSGSLRFYTGRRILRWDYLDPAWLDRGVAWLRANGHPTYAVLDLSELEEMKRRYGPARQAAMGRLIPLGGFAETRVYEVR